MSVVIPLRPNQGSVECAVYSVAEVAALLDLSLGLTYALVRDGTIPARKLGGCWKVPKAAFHAWLNSTTPEDKDVS